MRARVSLCVFALFGVLALGGAVLAASPGQRKSGASAPAKSSPADVRAAIEAANRKFAQGIEKKDSFLVASVYTQDAEAFPPNADVVKGRAGVQKMWQSVIDAGITSVAVDTTEVESSGNLAYEVGTYEMKTKDGVADRGKYCVVWKRVGGQWQLHRDIWSTSMPEKK